VRAYETMIVLAPTLDDAALEAAIERFCGVIAAQRGEVTHIDRWGRRRLAYEIEGHRDAFYVLISFNAEPGSTAELERILRISDGVLRFVVALQVVTKRAPAQAEAAAEAPAMAEPPATANALATAETPAASEAPAPAAPADEPSSGEQAGRPAEAPAEARQL
jgi:small subunit ribosomal protein S6